MTRKGRAQLHPLRTTLLVVFAALTSIGTARADLATRFTHYSVEHGLSQAAVETIIQDRQGFIWLGTDEGLNRFDGHNFVTFVNDRNDPTTLAHNWVWALHEDADGAIWVGTDGGGLDRLDPLTGVFEHHALTADRADRVVVRAIVEDSAGALWIGTDGDGVFRLDRSTGTTTRFRNDPERSQIAVQRSRKGAARRRAMAISGSAPTAAASIA